MKKKSYKLMAAVALATAAAGCTIDSPVTDPAGIAAREAERAAEQAKIAATSDPTAFAKGADVSWLTELEKQGYTFQSPDGEKKELMTLLRDDCGMNAIRLRVWVDPADGWCATDDVVLKARRAAALGMRLMVDFHFSDSWADPAQQNPPAAWADYDLTATCAAIASHVNDVLSAIKAQDVNVEWVQVGNETRTGMLWPLGELADNGNFAAMVNAGYDAVKAVFPDAAVIVHCDCGNERYLYTNLFGKLDAQGARYDMIGMSLYPEPDNYATLVGDCLANVDYVKAAYQKPVIICEVGMDSYEAEAAKAMLTQLMAGCIARDVKGIFWWEPESPREKYTKGCFDDNGAPTVALDCFKQ